MTKKDKVNTLPVDRETWKLMHYDSLYYVPSKAYNEYDFLKILSLKKKEVKDKDGRQTTE